MKRTCAVVVLMLAAALILISLRRERTAAPANAGQAIEPVPASATNNVTRQARPALTSTSASAQTNALRKPSTNLLTRLLTEGGEPPRLSRKQADAFASSNGRRAEALLAAWQASRDPDFLREAMEKYPNDPHVAYMAWSRGAVEETPEAAAKAKAEWLQKFKEADPDNAVASYLSARAMLKAGDLDAALNELSSAEDKSWRDYTPQSIQNVEEAYLAAGFSEAESKAIASMGALLPHLAELRGLGKSLNELAATRREAGDPASADAAVQWALQLGHRTGDEGTLTLIQQLVSLAIQRDTLKTLDPGANIGDGLTAQQRLASLEEQRKAIQQVARDSGEIMPRLSEPDLARYFDRLKLFGEEAAVQWAKARVQAN